MANSHQIVSLSPGTASCGNFCATCGQNTQVDVPVETDDGRELGTVSVCVNESNH